MTTTTEYEVPTWSQICEMLLNQATKIQNDKFKPDLILAVNRGGLVPARILSDLLETKSIATIGIEFYKGIAQTKNEPELTQRLTAQVKDKKILIVDDITDTGRSLKLAKDHLILQCLKEVKIATLYAKSTSIIQPDYFEKETSRWIVFPWDIKETIRNIAEKQKGKREVNKEIAKLVKAGLPKNLAQKFLNEIKQETKNASTL